LSISTGKLVWKKKFEIVSACCNKLCFESVDATKQKSLFHTFFNLADESVQDMYLGFLMKPQIPKKHVNNP